jgi:chromosome partitioning protein
MKVVSVLNYKGGVGKTTLTAYLGAELARLGLKVLLIDMDPQSNLTFCFYHPDEWRTNLRDKYTIKQWFDSFRNGRPTIGLNDVIRPPARVNASVGGQGGRLDLIASHLRIITIDLDLATDLRGTGHESRAELFQVRQALADALADAALAHYDFVLIDCPPSFNILTQCAIVASSDILIPARADYLSTIGIEFLYGTLHELVQLHNDQVRKGSSRSRRDLIAPRITGVVFTMIQFYRKRPIAAQQYYINRVQQLGLPVFRSVVRENATLFGDPVPRGVPTVVSDRVRAHLSAELRALAAEFLDHFRVGKVAA